MGIGKMRHMHYISSNCEWAHTGTRTGATPTSTIPTDIRSLSFSRFLGGGSEGGGRQQTTRSDFGGNHMVGGPC